MKRVAAECHAVISRTQGTEPEQIPVSGRADSAVELRKRIQSLIGDDLTRVNQILKKQFQNPHPYITDVLQHAGCLRGKQIRPVLLLLCRKSISGHIEDSVVTLAAVVEMIHTATLVHDDVLDNALSRRHIPTVNHHWNTETSVLLGDYLFSRAFRLAASTGDASACELIGRATDLTCAGELHQIAAREHRSESERDYFRIIRGKTGQLFGLSCLLGARTATASRHLQRQIHIAGIEAGMAFQIADDVLDLTGEETQTGKDSGNDLVNQRLTLPVLRALQTATSTERDELRDLLNRNGVCKPGTQFTGHRNSASGHPAMQRGISSAKKTARHLVSSCIRRLAQLPDSENRRLLESIVHFSVRRQN
ncbi:MAG: polyprenyl synthetase family protein [Fuerstiella sp.]|nr:polyprenyl synthetase family protein [Fuerstiella sp.]